MIFTFVILGFTVLLLSVMLITITIIVLNLSDTQKSKKTIKRGRGKRRK